MYCHSVCWDQGKLLRVHIVIFISVNPVFTISTLYGLITWSNWTLSNGVCCDCANCPNGTPFTRLAFVSMLRCSITRAPTARVSLASKPPVMLQSLLSFCCWLAAFLLYLHKLAVSCTSSAHSFSITGEARQLSISLLKSTHPFLVGKRQTGLCPLCSSSINLPELILQLHAVQAYAVSPQWGGHISHSLRDENVWSCFCLSVMVSSPYTTHSFQVLTTVVCSEGEYCSGCNAGSSDTGSVPSPDSIQLVPTESFTRMTR